MWDEASTTLGLRLPLCICPPSSGSFKADTASEMADPEKNGSEKALPSSDSLSKVSEQPSKNEKEAKVTKGVPADVIKPQAVPEDHTKDSEAPRMELVLAMLLIPTTGDPKSTNQGSSKTTAQQPKAPPHGKIVIKKK